MIAYIYNKRDIPGSGGWSLDAWQPVNVQIAKDSVAIVFAGWKDEEAMLSGVQPYAKPVIITMKKEDLGLKDSSIGEMPDIEAYISAKVFAKALEAEFVGGEVRYV